MMGLRKNESWDDYINRDVYVSPDYGMTGYIAKFINHQNDKVTVREQETDAIRTIPSENVYGLWILQDW